LIKGKFDLKEIPSAEEVKDKKGKVIKKDYTEVDDFFEKHLKDFSEKMGKNKTSKPVATSKKVQKNTDDEAGDEDIPF
jgi:hypothetical protein